MAAVVQVPEMVLAPALGARVDRVPARAGMIMAAMVMATARGINPKLLGNLAASEQPRSPGASYHEAGNR